MARQKTFSPRVMCMCMFCVKYGPKKSKFSPCNSINEAPINIKSAFPNRADVASPSKAVSLRCCDVRAWSRALFIFRYANAGQI